MPGHIEQPIGHVLDGLGITAHIPPDTLVAGAIVILKTIPADGPERISVTISDQLGLAERVGMLRLAETITTTSAAGRRRPGA